MVANLAPICRREESIYSKVLKEGMMPAPMHDGFWVAQIVRGVQKIEIRNEQLTLVRRAKIMSYRRCESSQERTNHLPVASLEIIRVT